MLKIAADLQRIRRERVDFDTVIQYLVGLYTRERIDLDAWRRFTKQIPSVTFEDLYSDLMKERRQDDRVRQWNSP